MKILILPLLIILSPIILLYLTIKFWIKKHLSVGLKIAIGLVFALLGIVLTLVAMNVSIQGHMDAGIKCASGAITLIPIGLFVNVVGIPLLLFAEKKIHKKKE